MVYTSSNTSNKSTPGKVKPTIFEQIGGEKALLQAARTFTARLAKDEAIAKAFAKLEAEKQAKMLAGFLAHVTGGPAYTGPSMYEFHRQLCLKDSHYDAYLEILEETLLDCDMPMEGVQKIMAVMREQRGEVLGKGKKSGCCNWVASWMDKCPKYQAENAVYFHIAGATLAAGLIAAAGFLAFKTLRKHD